MGFPHVRTRLMALASSNGAFEADFLVDTGATDCVAPAGALRDIGVEEAGTRSYELADGSRREYPYGFVKIEVMGELTVGRCVFGPDGMEPLLGVTALGSIGLTVDPITQQLKKLPSVRLK